MQTETTNRPSAAEPQPNPYLHADFTEGNEGNEGPGKKLRLFVSFVTFCKIPGIELSGNCRKQDARRRRSSAGIAVLMHTNIGRVNQNCRESSALTVWWLFRIRYGKASSIRVDSCAFVVQLNCSCSPRCPLRHGGGDLRPRLGQRHFDHVLPVAPFQLEDTFLQPAAAHGEAQGNAD